MKKKQLSCQIKKTEYNQKEHDLISNLLNENQICKTLSDCIWMHQQLQRCCDETVGVLEHFIYSKVEIAGHVELTRCLKSLPLVFQLYNSGIIY